MSFPRYERYKDSGVAWLGKVPEHWGTTPFWTYFKRTKSVGHPKEELLSIYRDYGVVRKTDRDDNFNNASEDLGLYQLVTPGNLVINKMKAWQGSVAISDYKGIVSPAYFVYSPTHKEHSKYLNLLMRSTRYILGYLTLSKGIRINQWDLDPAYHSRMPLLVPPTQEQQRISDFLDQETAKIDALIEEQRRLIALLKEKRQAVISHAVTKGLNPAAPMKDSNVESLGPIPSHWNLVPLCHLVRFFSGGTPSRNNAGYWDGTIPWVSPKDMKAEEVIDSQDHVTDLAVLESGLHLFPSNFLLIVVRGMILAHSFPIARNSVPVTINQDMKAIQCGERLELMFLQEFFVGLKSLIVSLATESAHGTLKLESAVLNTLQIPLPTLDEQKSIARSLKDQKQKLDLLASKAKNAITLLQERRSALISAAVTGKIDVRNYASPKTEVPEEVYELA